MRTYLPVLQNERGSVLIPILVSSVAAMGLFWGVYNQYQTQTRLERTIAQNFAARNAVIQIEKILSDPNSCLLTFQGLNPAGTGASVNDIRSPGAATPVFRVNDVLGSGSLQLGGVTITSSPAPGTGIVTLTFNRVGQSLSPAPLRRVVNVTFQANGANQIIQCNASSTAGVDQACTSIGGSIVGGKCRNITLYGALNVQGQITVNGDITEVVSKSGDLTVGTLATNALKVDLLKVNGDLLVDKNLTLKGTSKFTINQEFKANTLKVKDQFCVNSVCRDFSPQQCPPGQYLYEISANGSIKCANF